MALRGLQATEVFSYDEMQRLRRSSRDWTGTSPPPHEEESYTYDDLGNILSKSNYGSAYSYGSATRAGDNAGPHAVKSVRKTDGTTATFTVTARRRSY